MRNSNIEILRVISMLIIIMHHFCLHGVISHTLSSITIETYTWQIALTQFLGWGGTFANCVFVLITGYYMIDRQISYKKIVELIVIMCFYSWLIALIFYGTGIIEYSFNGLIKAAIPFVFGYNWFVCCYIILMLFSPFINKCMSNFSKQEQRSFLILGLGLFTVLPLFHGANFMNNSQIILFTLMYAGGGHVRKYCDFKLGFKYVLVALVVIFASMIIMCAIGIALENVKFIKNMWYFIPCLSVFFAIICFKYAIDRKVFSNPKINSLSGLILGVYLIHDNPIIRKWLWDVFYPNMDYTNSQYFILFLLIKVIAVFAICLIIERIRKYIFNKVYIW